MELHWPPVIFIPVCLLLLLYRSSYQTGKQLLASTPKFLRTRPAPSGRCSTALVFPALELKLVPQWQLPTGPVCFPSSTPLSLDSTLHALVVVRNLVCAAQLVRAAMDYGKR